jgi:glycosyltransferase involved in cell wall biosynthesis
MRIAVITTSYPSHDDDPAGHFVRAEVKQLQSQGHTLTLFKPNPPKMTPLTEDATLHLVGLPHGELFGFPGAIERVKLNPLRLVGVVPFIALGERRLRQIGPFDHLITHWILPSFWPLARNYVGETTAIAHGSDVRLLEQLPANLQQRVLRALGRPNVRLRCVSRELAERLRRLAEKHNVKAVERCSVEPCAIDIPTLPDQAELRRVLGVTQTPLVVVVGRAVKDKQIPIAIEASTRAFGRPPYVIGDGPELPTLRQHYRDTVFLGSRCRRETVSWIKAADVLLSASEKEGAPTVVREARALGTPVVCADAGDLRAWAQSDPFIYVAAKNEGSAESLVRALAQALTLCVSGKPATTSSV